MGPPCTINAIRCEAVAGKAIVWGQTALWQRHASTSLGAPTPSVKTWTMTSRVGAVGHILLAGELRVATGSLQSGALRLTCSDRVPFPRLGITIHGIDDDQKLSTTGWVGNACTTRPFVSNRLSIAVKASARFRALTAAAPGAARCSAATPPPA